MKERKKKGKVKERQGRRKSMALNYSSHLSCPSLMKEPWLYPPHVHMQRNHPLWQQQVCIRGMQTLQAQLTTYAWEEISMPSLATDPRFILQMIGEDMRKIQTLSHPLPGGYQYHQHEPHFYSRYHVFHTLSYGSSLNVLGVVRDVTKSFLLAALSLSLSAYKALWKNKEPEVIFNTCST